MHIILFPPLHENCGYYGNGKSKNVAKKDPEITQKLFKLA